MTTVFCLYFQKDGIGGEVWDLCGIYQTHDAAMDAMMRVLSADRLLTQEMAAIDEVTLNQDLQ